MRLGVIADVHGNLPALEAALAAMSRAGVDSFACLGDLVGYGPFPEECVERVAALRPFAVAGNHDLVAVGRPEAGRRSPRALAEVDWTRQRLGTDALGWLGRLPLVAEAPGHVVMTHGALGDPERAVLSRSDAAAQLHALGRSHPTASVLLLGHTHLSYAHGQCSGRLLAWGTGTVRWAAEERVLLNPGAVGHSRERSPRARCMVLDAARREAVFLAERYDVDALEAALRRFGRPPGACHEPPPRGRAALRTARMRFERVARNLAS